MFRRRITASPLCPAILMGCPQDSSKYINTLLSFANIWPAFAWRHCASPDVPSSLFRCRERPGWVQSRILAAFTDSRAAPSRPQAHRGWIPAWEARVPMPTQASLTHWPARYYNQHDIMCLHALDLATSTRLPSYVRSSLGVLAPAARKSESGETRAVISKSKHLTGN